MGLVLYIFNKMYGNHSPFTLFTGFQISSKETALLALKQTLTIVSRHQCHLLVCTCMDSDDKIFSKSSTNGPRVMSTENFMNRENVMSYSHFCISYWQSQHTLPGLSPFSESCVRLQSSWLSTLHEFELPPLCVTPSWCIRWRVRFHPWISAWPAEQLRENWGVPGSVWLCGSGLKDFCPLIPNKT